jgi:hypothetical protein
MMQKTGPYRIASALLMLLSVTMISNSAAAQSSTRILKYNDKGEVTGVIEKQTKGRSGTTSKTTKRSGKPREYRNDPTEAEQPSAEPGEIIVIDPPAGFERAVRADGYSVLERTVLGTLGFTVLRLRTPAGTDAATATRTIGAAYPGLTIGVNQRFTLNVGPQGDYGRGIMGWGEVTPACGSGIRIGIIDTLVDVLHPAIKGQRIARRSFIPKNKKPGISDHGTAIAGILIGKADSGDWKGLLPGASLYAANIFSARSDGGLRANLASMMKALDWLAQKKVQVANFSLAGSSNKVLSKIIERASQRGMALVAAAGNGGAKARPAFPAAHPMVLAVTAIDERLAPYKFANQGDYIDFSAPGVRLWTARKNGGGLQSGTSFASPYIAAAVALHIANGSNPGTQTLRKKLRGFTKDLGAPGRDAIFGWGLVRIRPNC